jgi:hypothetical protein
MISLTFLSVCTYILYLPSRASWITVLIPRAYQSFSLVLQQYAILRINIHFGPSLHIISHNITQFK